MVCLRSFTQKGGKLHNEKMFSSGGGGVGVSTCGLKSTYVPRSTSAFWIIATFADLITICCI